MYWRIGDDACAVNCARNQVHVLGAWWHDTGPVGALIFMM